jgi:hypothetical protein
VNGRPKNLIITTLKINIRLGWISFLRHQHATTKNCNHKKDLKNQSISFFMFFGYQFLCLCFVFGRARVPRKLHPGERAEPLRARTACQMHTGPLSNLQEDLMSNFIGSSDIDYPACGFGYAITQCSVVSIQITRHG